MSIQSVSLQQGVAAITKSPAGQSAAGGGGQAFQGVLESLRSSKSIDQVNTVIRQVLQGKSFTPAELLKTQVLVSVYSQRVELLSRAAESGVTTMRRLQGQG